MNEIRSAQEELTKVFSEAGQAFYQQQGQEAGATAGAEGSAEPGAASGDGAKQDDVVEADYEIVDDAKK
jgi:molecular chaperone DnaK